MIKRNLFGIIFALIFAATVWGEDAGGLGAIFRYGAGAREIALGRTGIVATENSNGIFSNPAQLSLLRNAGISMNYVQLYEGDYDSSLSFSIPLPEGITAGAGAIYRLSEGYPVFDDNNIRTGDASIADTGILLGFGMNAGYGISVGLSGKYYDKKIYKYQDSTFSFDFGVTKKFSLHGKDDLTAGLFLQDLYSQDVKFISEKEKLKLSSRAGLGFWLIPERLLFSAETYVPLDQSRLYFTGLEFWLYRYLKLRAGLNPNELSAGLGIKFQDIWLDYAFSAHQRLGNHHRMSINFSFSNTGSRELSKPETIKELPAPEPPPAQEPDQAVKESAEQTQQLEQNKEIIREEKSGETENDYSAIIRTAENIPTGIYDLLEKRGFSVINIIFENKTDRPASFKVNYQIEDRTREESIIVRAKSREEKNYYPPLLPETITKLEVHTPAVILVRVFLIDEQGNQRWVAEKTAKTMLNPYDQFCIEMSDARGEKFDLTATLISWITYNDRRLNEVLSKAADQGSMLIPPVKIIGDQPPRIFTRIIEDDRTLQEKDSDYTRQIKLIYDTLRNDYKITYLNQPILYKDCQRIKLPAAVLKEKGNCIELVVLMASLLESIEIEPIVALFPQDGHAALGWRVEKDDVEVYHFIEPNLFGEDFAKLIERGKELVSANGLDDEIKNGIPFPQDGIYKKGSNIILLDVKQIRTRIPPSPYIPK